MGLQSSMWSSVSGLLAHGEKMNVISNNLANVSTIGFKSQRMDFEDFVYQDKFSGGGATQVGLGVGINTIVTDYSQGSFESTNSSTDLAITGAGFFKVVNQSTGSDYYTRAGNYNFNSEGYLTLPSGEVLQGWKINNNTTPMPATGINPVVAESTTLQTVGEPTDIILDTWTVAPKATTKVEFSVNLTAEEELDKSINKDNPLFAMAENWNGKDINREDDDYPLSEEAYVHSAPIKVYDEGGNEHTLTTYFDQVPASTITNLPSGYEVYEYMLTMNPEDDARTFGGTYNAETGVLSGATSFQETEAAGILMKGTMIFDASGNLVSQTAYTYMGNTDFPDGATVPAGTDPAAVLEAAETAAAAAVADAANITQMEAAGTTAVTGDDAVHARVIKAAMDEAGVIPEVHDAILGNVITTSAASMDADIKAKAEAAGTAAGTAAGGVPGDPAYDAAYNQAYHDVAMGDKAYAETYYKDYANQMPADTDTAIVAALTALYPAGNATTDAAIAAGNAAVAPATYEDEYIKSILASGDTAYINAYNSYAAYAPAYSAGVTNSPEYKRAYQDAYDTTYDTAFNGVYDADYADTLGHPDSDLSWQPTEVSESGYPLFTANFSGHPMGNAVGQAKAEDDTTQNKGADDIWMEFDLGLQSKDPSDPWEVNGGSVARVTATVDDTGTVTVPTSDSIADVIAVGGAVTSVDYQELAKFIPNDRATGSSTMRGTASSINFSSQDGHGSGNLTNVHVDADGIVYGVYSNGINMPLYQVAMYDFVNPQGLYREGGNLYSETIESGSIQLAQAGIGGMGSINSYNIENSNVDMSREFVNMIITQRGFQGNSKGITTVDELLNTVIGMKR